MPTYASTSAPMHLRRRLSTTALLGLGVAAQSQQACESLFERLPISGVPLALTLHSRCPTHAASLEFEGFHHAQTLH